MTSLILPPGGTDILLPGRRRFLQGLAGVAAAAAVPAFGQPSDFWSLPRELWLFRPSTREHVRAVYWADGQLVQDGYVQLCRLLRDVQANTAVQFDLVTLDIARGFTGGFAPTASTSRSSSTAGTGRSTRTQMRAAHATAFT